MANHNMNGEAITLERTTGAFTGSGKWKNGETCMPGMRTPEANKMCGQSSLNLSLIHSHNGR
jgi:hypothetical protein